MIVVTRLHGSSMAVNCDLIERVESTPDTVVTLVDGSRSASPPPGRRESLAGQRIRRGGLCHVTFRRLHPSSPTPRTSRRYAPFAPVQGKAVEVDAMTDQMLVRRLAIDLRNLADKTLALRGAVEDYRHDLVRTIEDDWCDDKELLALQRQVQELWGAMDRAEAKLRSGSRRMSPLLWLE